MNSSQPVIEPVSAISESSIKTVSLAIQQTLVAYQHERSMAGISYATKYYNGNVLVLFEGMDVCIAGLFAVQNNAVFVETLQ